MIGYRAHQARRKNASNHPDLALPKGITRREEQIAAQRYQCAVISRVRAVVFAASQICAICGDNERETARKFPMWRTHEMHEDPSRAMTKGRPAEERFNSTVCMRLCHFCHVRYGYRVRCLALTDTGWAGSYDVQRKDAAGEWVTVLTVRRPARDFSAEGSYEIWAKVEGSDDHA